ncbi:MAG: hypothetical protein AB4426_30170 [Xenococcaceae cyanobacterium]
MNKSARSLRECLRQRQSECDRNIYILIHVPPTTQERAKHLDIQLNDTFHN